MKKDVENFGALYTRLYNENFARLETLRRKEQATALFLILTSIGVFTASMFLINAEILEKYLVIILIVTALIIISLIKNIKTKMRLGYEARNYVLEFKNKVIGPIIKNAIPNSNYYINRGISRLTYDSSGLAENYDIYKSEDLIEVKLELQNKQDKTVNIKLSEVLAIEIIKNDDGKEEYVTRFNGMVGEVELTKDIGAGIVITKNGRISKRSYNKVEMDIEEFEKLFDVKSDDKILTMRVLTADVMMKLVDLSLESKIRFEINIKKDKLYVRFHTGPMYEPSIFRKTLEFTSIKRFYTCTKMLLSTCKQIALVVDDIEI
ncbi:MAG: DUF3137 domain-containing protein [Clostridia bacterium]|nr:DUF3137 domain-containing protein [Clostridia bacterium]MDD4376354.1 DUF3137 domain-containing protein [Clostridia bacterium]